MAESVRVVDVSDLTIHVEYVDGYIESTSYITDPPLIGAFEIVNSNPSWHKVNLVDVNVNYNWWETVGHTIIYTPNGSDTDVSLAFHWYEDFFRKYGTDSEQKIATIKNYTYVNLPPIANNDIIVFEKSSEGYFGNLIQDNGFGEDSDPNWDYISAVEATIKTEHGIVTIGDSFGHQYFGEFEYKPNNPDFVGEDSFEYVLQDSTGLQSTASVSIIFLGNKPPIANDDAFTLDKDTTLLGNVLLNNGNGADSDPNGDPLKVVSGTFATANGNVTLSQFGTFSYTPNAGYVGEDSFEYTLEDGQGGTDMATVHIQINAPNSPPDAKNDTFSINEDTILSGNVLADHGNGADTDPNGDVLHVFAQTFTTAKGGTVILSESGDFTYSPKADFYGTDSFTYKLLDDSGAHDFAKVTIQVNDVADFYIGTDEGDRYVGGYQNDTLIGLRGDDVLFGGSGWDRLYGNEGNDTLYGGKGSDRLNGGGDSDLFVLDGINFNRPDTIEDLRLTEGDRIQIKDILNFDPLTDAITDFVQITQNGADSLLSVDINGTDGGASFEVAARIKGVTGLDVNQLYADGDLVISNTVAV